MYFHEFSSVVRRISGYNTKKLAFLNRDEGFKKVPAYSRKFSAWTVPLWFQTPESLPKIYASAIRIQIIIKT
jgi:hypothetical protein